MGRKPFTGPGEDFLFRVTLNLDLPVVYKFQFDDGVTIVTSSREVSHAWMQAGQHHVTVSTQIGVVPLTATQQVSSDVIV